MYKAIITNGRKEPTFISLNTGKSDELVKPVYDGNYISLKKIVESSYNQFGHLIGSRFSVEEFEFAIRQLGFELKVLEDVERNEFYQVEKSELYS